MQKRATVWRNVRDFWTEFSTNSSSRLPWNKIGAGLKMFLEFITLEKISCSLFDTNPELAAFSDWLLRISNGSEDDVNGNVAFPPQCIIGNSLIDEVFGICCLR